jgi:hypothetical protein
MIYLVASFERQVVSFVRVYSSNLSAKEVDRVKLLYLQHLT